MLSRDTHLTEYDLWLIEERDAPLSDEGMGRIALSTLLDLPQGFYEQPPVLDTLPLGSLAYHVPVPGICSVCGNRLSEALCDYPVGRGRTCDRSLCAGCRHRVGPGSDLDYCPEHNRRQPSLFEQQMST